MINYTIMRLFVYIFFSTCIIKIMRQLELFKLNYSQETANKIRYWRNKIRTDERNIYKREKRKSQTELKLSSFTTLNNHGVASLSLHRDKKKYIRILELEIKILSITYELYFDSHLKLDLYYKKLWSNLRLVNTAESFN